MKKKVVSVILAMTMVASMAMGCGNSSDTTTSDNSTTTTTTNDVFILELLNTKRLVLLF